MQILFAFKFSFMQIMPYASAARTISAKRHEYRHECFQLAMSGFITICQAPHTQILHALTFYSHLCQLQSYRVSETDNTESEWERERGMKNKFSPRQIRISKQCASTAAPRALQQPACRELTKPLSRLHAVYIFFCSGDFIN